MVLRSFVDIQLIDRQDVVIQLIDRQDVVIQIHQDYEGYLLTPEGACPTPHWRLAGSDEGDIFGHFFDIFGHFFDIFGHFIDIFEVGNLDVNIGT
jgi:hypothetical protein